MSIWKNQSRKFRVFITDSIRRWALHVFGYFHLFCNNWDRLETIIKETDI